MGDAARVEGAPPELAALVAEVAGDLMVPAVTAVQLAAPDDEVKPFLDLPGDTWLTITVPRTEQDGNSTAANWDAARLAGAVRNQAKSAGLPVPFGYSIVPTNATAAESTSVVIGAPFGTAPTPVSEATAVRIGAVAMSLGLQVTALELRGSGALVLVAQTDESGKELIGRWPTIAQSLVGDLDMSDWMIEIDDPSGQPIRALANSVSTWARFGWTRPDLRELEYGLQPGMPPRQTTLEQEQAVPSDGVSTAGAETTPDEAG